MTLLQIVGVALQVLFLFLKHKTSPDVAYEEAVRFLSSQYVENVDEFAEKVADRDLDGLADMLRDLKRRRMSRT